MNHNSETITGDLDLHSSNLIFWPIDLFYHYFDLLSYLTTTEFITYLLIKARLFILNLLSPLLTISVNLHFLPYSNIVYLWF